MSSPASGRQRVVSGVGQLDRILGGLYIGDNVVWHDSAGSLALVFCYNFIQSSQAQDTPLIYASFDRSPRNLLEKLGALADYPSMIILDCFTFGKGAGSPVFMKFYEETAPTLSCRLVPVEEPRKVESFMDVLYGTHAGLTGNVHFVFESITGMQEIWGGEEDILQFYSHSCPRLYELNTIAYWIMEKSAHSPRLRAYINQIAQVAIDLEVKRGTTILTILKAEQRSQEDLNKPHRYWTKDLNITFEDERGATGRIDLGLRLKELRTKRGLSQAELAKLVGVTPSTISQVESDLIYPSLPALLKMAEVLSVEVSSFFENRDEERRRIIFPAADSVEVMFPDLPRDAVFGRLLTTVDFESRAEPYMIEISPNETLPAHFFVHKGEEFGYLLSGRLQLRLKQAVYSLRAGDVVYLTSEMPTQWRNPGPGIARLLWVKVK